MSGYDEHDEQNAPKALREALEKANKELKALREADEAKTQKLNELSLTTVLQDKKIPPSIARWIKKDGVEPTAEAVDKWLEENGGDFGWKPGAQEASEGTKPEEAPTQGATAPQPGVLSEADVALLQRLQGALDGSSSQPFMPADQQKSLVDQVASNVSLGYASTDFNDVVRQLKEAGIPIGGNLAH